MVIIKIKRKTIIVEYIEFDGRKFYKDGKGYWLGSFKGCKPKRLHVYVWEYYNGKVPKGHHIHHIDFNPDNNNIENLKLMPASEHISMHSKINGNKLENKKKFIENTIPKAMAWHKSQAAVEFGKINYERSLGQAAKIKIKLICQYCGKEYITNKTRRDFSKFCSNACKAANRRKIKADDIIKTCVVCGLEFKSGKYKGAKTCSTECRSKLLVYTRNGIKRF